MFPGVQIFCMYTAAAVVMDYIYQLTFFLGIMCYVGDMEQAGRHAITMQPVVNYRKSSKLLAACFGVIFRLIFYSEIKYAFTFTLKTTVLILKNILFSVSESSFVRFMCRGTNWAQAEDPRPKKTRGERVFTTTMSAWIRYTYYCYCNCNSIRLAHFSCV